MGALLVLATLSSGARDRVLGDEDRKRIQAAQKDLLDLAKAIEAGQADPKKIAAFPKKYPDLDDLMIGLKPRDKGGIGVGPKGPTDGIELKLNELGKRALSKKQLDKEAKDLLRIGYISLAFAKVTHEYAPGPKDAAASKARLWRDFTEEWSKASQGLIDSVKAKDPDAVRRAAQKLNEACNNCHFDGP
jgi:hypothetical protein